MIFEDITIFDTKEKIEAEIKRLEEVLPTVKGKTTEVYSRIVGYYRNVGNWNQGKSEEWEERKVFDVEKLLFDLKNKQKEGV
jgi:ribonucleoside-triphosphate reductase